MAIHNQSAWVHAINVGTDVDSEGNLGNLVSFENCTFLRNRAAEFGAAIGVYTLLYFREISNITPFQLTSWSAIIRIGPCLVRCNSHTISTII